MRVHEHGDVIEVVVVIDDVRQVHHHLVALVGGHVERGGVIVDGVDGTRQVGVGLYDGVDPGGVVFLQSGDHEGLGGILAWPQGCGRGSGSGNWSGQRVEHIGPGGRWVGPCSPEFVAVLISGEVDVVCGNEEEDGGDEQRGGFAVLHGNCYSRSSLY